MDVTKMNKAINVCCRCVMNTTDPWIKFDEKGECSHCKTYDEQKGLRWFPDDEGKKKLSKIFEKIKSDQKNKEYDCIMGLSGGVDSSYLAYLSRNWGLRILAIHVDGGWNSELAVQNIQMLVDKCKLDLYTYVVDWEEMKDLQVAYLKSGIANQDVPQDHIFFSILYQKAIEFGIPYVLTGANFATESCLPQAWEYDQMDSVQLRAIHKRFGTKRLKSYKTISFYNLYIYYRFFKKLKKIDPLNYMPYDKEAAKKELIEELKWKDYGLKHGESRWTKFFQNYYLPHKFGYDKRISHFSSLILSAQMSREEALLELDKPLYSYLDLKNDKEYIAKKLDLTVSELDNLIDAPNKHYTDYPNGEKIFNILKFFKKIIS